MTGEEMAAIKARADREGWDQHTMWMVTLGELDADEIAERARVREAATGLRGLPIDQWPPIQIRLDLSVEARHHALDGEKASDFASRHSRGDWALLCLPMDELKASFRSSACRAPEEIWEVRSLDKAARALVRWSEGRRMTPPIYAIWEDREITVAGGNHRVAVADAVGVRRVPAHVHQAALAVFRRLVPGAVPIPDAVIDDLDAWDTTCC